MKSIGRREQKFKRICTLALPKPETNRRVSGFRTPIVYFAPYWQRGPAPQKGEVRPAIIVSADACNESRSPLVAILPLARAQVKNPLHVTLTIDETGLDAASTSLIDARFVDRSRLRPDAAGRLIRSAQARVDRNLARVFGLSPGTA